MWWTLKSTFSCVYLQLQHLHLSAHVWHRSTGDMSPIYRRPISYTHTEMMTCRYFKQHGCLWYPRRVFRCLSVSRHGWPPGSFYHLHTGTLELSQTDLWVRGSHLLLRNLILKLIPLVWLSSVGRVICGSIVVTYSFPQICSMEWSCLWSLEAVLVISWLWSNKSAPSPSDIIFPNHIQ